MTVNPSTSRRDFIKTSAAAVAGSAFSLSQAVHAAGSDVLRVGLIGCGGRGTGAAVQALQADANVKLVALADAFRRPASEEPEITPEKRSRQPRSRGCGPPASSASTPTKADRQAASTWCSWPRRRTSARLTSRPPSTRASTSSPRSRSPSTPPASARSWRPARRRRRRTWRSSPACAGATTSACGRRSSRSTTARSATSSTLQSNYNTALPGKPWPMIRKPGWSDMEWQMRNWY